MKSKPEKSRWVIKSSEPNLTRKWKTIYHVTGELYKNTNEYHNCWILFCLNDYKYQKRESYGIRVHRFSKKQFLLLLSPSVLIKYKVVSSQLSATPRHLPLLSLYTDFLPSCVPFFLSNWNSWPTFSSHSTLFWKYYRNKKTRI